MFIEYLTYISICYHLCRCTHSSVFPNSFNTVPPITKLFKPGGWCYAASFFLSILQPYTCTKSCRLSLALEYAWNLPTLQTTSISHWTTNWSLCLFSLFLTNNLPHCWQNDHFKMWIQSCILLKSFHQPPNAFRIKSKFLPLSTRCYIIRLCPPSSD